MYCNPIKPYTVIRSVLLLLLLAITSISIAQVTLTNKGVEITNVGTKIFINGDYVNTLDSLTHSKSAGIASDDSIFFQGNITHTASNGLFVTNDGTAVFNGSSQQYLLGDTLIDFSNLLLQKPSGWLRLGNDANVLDSLVFNQGQLFLDTFSLDLKTTGSLFDESDTSYAFSQGGFIKARRFISSPNIANNIAGLGLQVGSTNNFSFTDLRRGHASQTGAGNGSALKYIEFSPSNHRSVDSLVFNYLSIDVGGAQVASRFSNWQSDNTGLVWRTIGGSADTTAQSVHSGTTDLKNSILTISERDCDFPPVVGLPDTVWRCQGDTATFDANNPGHFYNWSSGDTTRTINVSSAGTYTVTVTSVNGCVTIDTVELTFTPFPVAAFTSTVGCEGDSTLFTNGSTISNGDSLSFLWNFGDTSSLQDTALLEHPKYVYNYPGNKTAVLIATSTQGCSDTVSGVVNLHHKPTSHFGLLNACVDSSITFSDSASVGGGYSILSRKWFFGDGDTSIVTNPSHAYDTAKAYIVTYVVTTNAGCKDTASQNAQIYSNPKAAFTVNNVCQGGVAPISQLSTLPQGQNTFNWQFGDATNDTAQSPSKTYSNAGNYTISLTVTSAGGCKHDTSATVQIYDLPQVAYSGANICQNDSVQFTNTSTVSNGTLSYNWRFGDGSTSTATAPKKGYLQSGNYSTKLIATSSFGCVDSLSSVIAVRPVPNANFSATRVCEGVATGFTNTSTISSGTMTYQWKFGDGFNSTQNAPQHTYAQHGIKNVTLRATSNMSCVDSVVIPVLVDSLPIVQLGGTVVTCGNQFVLDAGNPGGNYLWSNFQTTQQTTVTFNGTYAVTVTTAQNCAASDTVTVTLNATPKTNIGPDTTVCGEYTLSALSQGGQYLWSNGATTPTITTAQSGQFSVRLTDQNNCISRDTAIVTIDTLPIPKLGADIIACDGESRTVSTQLSGVTYLWSNAASTPSINLTSSGLVRVTVTDANGCEGSDTLLATFNPTPSVNLGADTTVCDSLNLDAENTGATFVWSNGGSLQWLNAATSGVYWVEVTNAHSCSASDTIQLTVNASPVLDLGNDTTLCSGDSVVLSAGQTFQAYDWFDGTADSVLVTKNSGWHWLKVSDANQCTALDSVHVQFNPRPAVALGADKYLCSSDTVMLTGGDSAFTHQWFYNDTALATTSPWLFVADSGRFALRVSDSVGCAATDTVIVHKTSYEVHPRFLAASTIFAGDTIQFINLSYPSPLSYSWDFGDGGSSSDSLPLHPFFLHGSYDVKLKVSNAFCQDSLTKTITVKRRTKLEPIDEAEPLRGNFVELVSAKLYPNPTLGYAVCEVELDEEYPVEFRVFTLDGTLITRRKTNGQFIQQMFHFDHQPAGVYLIQILVGDQYKTLKLVKI